MTLKDKKLKKVSDEILNCKFCNKNKKGLLVVGEGSSKAKIIFVGEAPGKDEIKVGRPFIGRAGKLLRELIVLTQVPEQDFYIANAVKYLPKNYITPKPKDIEHGKLHLEKQLQIINPKVVVVLGNTSALSIIGKKVAIAKEHGTIIKKEDGVIYFLSYHPAAALYSPKLKPVMIKDFKKLKKLLPI